MDQNLHSQSRRLIELRIARDELQSRIEQLTAQGAPDELSLRRIERQCVKLRDQIARLEAELDPPQPA